MNEFERRLNAVDREQKWPNVKPRDAATLIILDKARHGQWRVLMGRRHMRHRFMPGKFVFPGGRVDPADSRAPSADRYVGAISEKLMAQVPTRMTRSRARALALTAIRETYEEAGVLIGNSVEKAPSSRNAEWRSFLDHNILPTIGGMRFIARAITPPRRPRRFDTRFFAVDADQIGHTLPTGTGPSGELEDVHWLTIGDAKTLDLPAITQVVLDELEARLKRGTVDDDSVPVPFYAWRHGRFRRSEL